MSKAKKEPAVVAAGQEVVCAFTLNFEVFRDGSLRHSVANVGQEGRSIPAGLQGTLVLAALELVKDAYLHRRWHSMDRKAHEDFMKQAGKRKARP